VERCLFCFGEIEENNWFSFLFPKWQRPVCRLCDDKMERIQGEICECCGRPFSNLAAEYREEDLCHDCIRWRRRGEVLGKNRSLYVYNDNMKEIINRFKFQGDEVMAHAFASEFRKVFRQYFSSYEIVPVPLSKERLQERGFNQAERLASLLPVPILACSLQRAHTEKQSKKTRTERIEGMMPFFFSDAVRFDNKDILLIDDIYTTGTTVWQIARLFREKGAARVASLTLCRG
jgi:competence protein ComFC